MNGDEIRFFQQRVKINFLVSFYCTPAIVVNNIHSECFCQFSHCFANIPHADNSQRASFQRESEIFHNTPHTFFFNPDATVTFGDSACGTQHEAHGHFCRWKAHCFRGVTNSDAFGTGKFDVDVVVTDTEIANYF